MLRFEIRSETARAITARAAGPRGEALLARWRALESRHEKEA